MLWVMQTLLTGPGYGYPGETVAPIAHGDRVLVQWKSRPLEHHVVLDVDSNIHGAVYRTIRLADGHECLVMESELRGRCK